MSKVVDTHGQSKVNKVTLVKTTQRAREHAVCKHTQAKPGDILLPCVILVKLLCYMARQKVLADAKKKEAYGWRTALY